MERPLQKLSASSDPFFNHPLQHHRFCFGNPPFIREIIPYRIPANIIMTCLTFLLMAPFLKALIGWNIITTKFIKDKLGWLFPHKQAEEIELAVKCAKEEHDNPEHSENTAAGGICTTLDDRTIRLRNFFSGTSQVSKIYYKLWMAKKATGCTDSFDRFRDLVSPFIYCNRRHQFHDRKSQSNISSFVTDDFFGIAVPLAA